MSVAFSSARPRSKGEVTQQTIQKVKKNPKTSRHFYLDILAWEYVIPFQCRESSQWWISKKWQLVLERYSQLKVRTKQSHRGDVDERSA